jgi:hypothetical protein
LSSDDVIILLEASVGIARPGIALENVSHRNKQNKPLRQVFIVRYLTVLAMQFNEFFSTSRTRRMNASVRLFPPID